MRFGMKIAMSLAAVSASTMMLVQGGDDPLRRPVAPDYAKRWLEPRAPIRVYGNFYLVGFGGLNLGLIDTGAGLILIDGALPQSVDAVEANIRRLGFDPKQLRYLFCF